MPSVGYDKWRKLRAEGIESRQDLVDRVSLAAATLCDSFDAEKLAKLVEQAKERPGEPAADLLRSNAKRMRSAFEDAGIETTDDLVEVVDSDEILPKGLVGPKDIANAQAALSTEAFIVKPGVTPQSPPRFDVEVDVDMENSIDDHVYLWGACVTDHTVGTTEYVPFVDWNINSAEGERDLFESFWDWFSTLQANTIKDDKTFGAYCWHKHAENRRLKELSALNLADEVDEFMESDNWIDLLVWFKDFYITGAGAGLKLIAPLAGFAWRAEDAGGEISMDYYEQQLNGEDGRDEARKWLLEYNEDDCYATLAIREWLDSLEVSQLKRVC